MSFLTRHPRKWAFVFGTLVCLVPGIFDSLSPRHPLAQEEDNISLLWTFIARIESNDNAKRLVAITQDTTLHTGDMLSMAVELRKFCFVYVIYQSSHGAMQRVFPYTAQQFITDYQIAKRYDIPRSPSWFILDNKTGRETFYLLVSTQRLTALEQLLDSSAAAPAPEQSLLAERIYNAITTLIRQHRRPPERPVPIIGTLRLPEDGTVEITANNFYSKTFTIEHR